MNWHHVMFNFYECWISGIYKITAYDDATYQAYYIKDGRVNWGWHVEPPPDRSEHHTSRGHPCWSSLERAKASCERHALNHSPKQKTIDRAHHLLSTADLIVSKSDDVSAQRRLFG